MLNGKDSIYYLFQNVVVPCIDTVYAEPRIAKCLLTGVWNLCSGICTANYNTKDRGQVESKFWQFKLIQVRFKLYIFSEFLSLQMEHMENEWNWCAKVNTYFLVLMVCWLIFYGCMFCSWKIWNISRLIKLLRTSFTYSPYSR